MNNKERTQNKKILAIIKEFLYLSQEFRSIDLKYLIRFLDNMDFIENDKINGLYNMSTQSKRDKPRNYMLVGILPGFFREIKLFPKNEDIAIFSKEVLGLEVTRWEKRSRYELIGLIVTEVSSRDEEKLEAIVEAIGEITLDDDKKQKIIKDKEDINFSWNDIIRRLGNNGQ